MSYFEQVSELIAEELEVASNQITLEAQIVDDLGADSLDLVELIMRLEEKFEIEIPDEDVEKITTVGDVVTYIESNKS